MADAYRGSSDVNQFTTSAASKQHLVAAKRQTERRALPLEVDALADLTQQIQSLQLTASASEKLRTAPSRSSSTKTDAAKLSAHEQSQQLAKLYCERAQAVLDAVDYDASVLLSASLFSDSASVAAEASSEPEEHEDYDESSSGEIQGESDGPILSGVEKALDDAVSAIALAPACADAYLVAAQCARCLGNTAHASEFLVLARQCAPSESFAHIDQLARELAVDANDVPLESFAPSIKTSPELLAVFDTPNQDEQQQQDDDDDDSEDSEHQSKIRESVYETLRTGLRTLHTIASAPWLRKLEQMMHENVHHQCTSRDEVRALEAALNDTVVLLGVLLANELTISALGLGDHRGVIHELQALLTADPLRGAQRQQLVVENRPLRKWIAQTLAPAVRRFPMQIGRAPLPALVSAVANGEGDPQQHREAVLALLVRDTLLVLTRVLLVAASWRRCTSMPHVLLYAELCADLAKEVGARDGAFSGLSRFEMMCSDVYARGLLELTTEHSVALQLHQESLQTALAIKDASYALRCHHLVGQALLRTGDLESAQSAFAEMLELSRTLGDSRMETLAQYELGESCVRHGNLPQAYAHFKRAQTLCHQTANAGGTWRDQSVQQAIAFYAALKPARRGAIRFAPARTCARRGSLVRTTSLKQVVAPAVDALSPSSSSSSSNDDGDAPKLRRPAIWIGPPKLQLGAEHNNKRSLMQTLLGEQTDPQLPDASSDEKQSLCMTSCAAAWTTSVTEKLFRTAAVERPQTPKRGATSVGKSRRAGSWRDSVFAVPPSYVELRSLAAAARSP